jgi:hypothetical protein
MGFEKTIDARIWGVTAQNSTLRTTVGDSSGGTFTARTHPLKGTLMWDRGMFVLQNVTVAGGATGGSYTVTIETDAVVGYTGLPIARATLGPNSPTTVVMDSLHQSPAIPLPTHLNIVQSAAGALTMTCDVIAKQYRGTLGTPGANTSERVLQGNMLEPAMSGVGGAGISADTTFSVDGTSFSGRGMRRMRHWDNALFWGVIGGTNAGTHDIDIVATVGGNTVSIATTGTAGALDIAGDSLSDRVAVANQFYGQCPNPSAIIWTQTTAGCSAPSVVMMAKSGRGSLAKR